MRKLNEVEKLKSNCRVWRGEYVGFPIWILQLPQLQMDVQSSGNYLRATGENVCESEREQTAQEMLGVGNSPLQGSELSDAFLWVEEEYD